jgi:S-adenosylmethionine-diacylgycerolhomoserine-N-methlytransferase
MDPRSTVERIYRRQRHIYDWTRPLVLPGRNRLLAGITAPEGARVLEIGCGTARNLICLARRHPSWALFGLDLSPSMLRTARSRIPLRWRKRILLAEGDATEPYEAFGTGPRDAPGSDARFDAIVFSYSLSMIHDPWRALELAARALRDGGSLHLADFGDEDALPAPCFKVLRGWLRRWGVRPVPRLAGLLQELAARASAAGEAELEIFERSRLRGGYAQIVRARRRG